MADVKKFTGYQAADGSIHTTEKAAVDHTVSIKTLTALKSFVEGLPGDGEEGSVVRSTNRGPAIMREELVAFLYDNRAAILAAFDQQANRRGPSKGRAKKPVGPSIHEQAEAILNNAEVRA